MRTAALLLCWAMAGTAADRVVFTKVFKGSTPEYVSIAVAQDNAVEYREDPEDDRPLHFLLAPEDTKLIFAAAARLRYFASPLASSAKVANMGLKTFRYERADGTHQETTFNYTENADARQLQDWFERMSDTEQCRYQLERAIKYDKLGVHDALLLVQRQWENRRLVAPGQLLPLLDRVAKSESMMQMSRERAAGLAELIRRPAATETKQ